MTSPTGPDAADGFAQLPDLAHAVREVDGVAPFSEQTLLLARRAATDPDHAPYARWVHEGSRLIGAVVGDAEGASYELAVHPDFRRRGRGTELLENVLRREPERLRVWSHGDLPAGRALASGRGLEVVRELWKMARPVDGEPAIQIPPLPAGFTARGFEPGRDEQSWLDVNARAFAHHPEQGKMTMADLHERMGEAWFDPAGLRLIEDVSGAEPVLAASHWTKIEDPHSGEGEVYVVAVDPAYQGRGLGRAVTALGLAHLAGAGVRTIDLYVEGDNAPAIATYRRWGFERAAIDVMWAPKTSPR